MITSLLCKKSHCKEIHQVTACSCHETLRVIIWQLFPGPCRSSLSLSACLKSWSLTDALAVSPPLRSFGPWNFFIKTKRNYHSTNKVERQDIQKIKWIKHIINFGVWALDPLTFNLADGTVFSPVNSQSFDYTERHCFRILWKDLMRMCAASRGPTLVIMFH